MLSNEQRDHLQQRLLEERGEALEALRQFDAERAASLEQQAGELSLYRLHMADLGTESMEREKAFMLGSKEGERLYRIDAALQRLYKEPESFGVCTECGEAISMERLELIPSAEHCAECQIEQEE